MKQRNKRQQVSELLCVAFILLPLFYVSFGDCLDKTEQEWVGGGVDLKRGGQNQTNDQKKRQNSNIFCLF